MLKRFRKKNTQQEVSSPVKSSSENKSPFFILGCVRSGTTMLRDLLRYHPNLECPEETHFFRWSDPYGTPRFLHPYRNNEGIRNQQRMDGISEDEFEKILNESASKKELAENYGRLYLKKQGNPNGRWFDKTPQNIYGVLLINEMFPDSKFIHIHRNPLNVVASLFEGKVMSINDISGATSYWIESIMIMNAFKKIANDKILEIPYEKITAEPRKYVDKILDFIGEDAKLIDLPKGIVHPEKNKYKKVLSKTDKEKVEERCKVYMEQYGYL